MFLPSVMGMHSSLLEPGCALLAAHGGFISKDLGKQCQCRVRTLRGPSGAPLAGIGWAQGSPSSLM